MSGFTFKFQSVLRHRQTVEDQCQRQLAQQLRLRMHIQQQLADMQQQITDSRHAMSKSLLGKVDMDQISSFARYSGQTANRAHQLLARFNELERHINASRENLLHATRARKAMELLRGQHQRAWHAEQARKQNIEMDELATQRYVRERALEGGA